jgi:MraZ protein
VIPQKLRAGVGIGRDVMVIGVSDRLEIWSGDAWDRYEESQAGAYTGGLLEPEG